MWIHLDVSKNLLVFSPVAIYPQTHELWCDFASATCAHSQKCQHEKSYMNKTSDYQKEQKPKLQTC